MENCLVTKLKAVVDNDNLLPLGAGIIEVNKDSDTPNCAVVCSGSTILKIHGTGTITDAHGVVSSTEIEILNGEQFTLSAGNYKVYYDKYNAVPSFEASAPGVTVNTEDLQYSNITTLTDLYGSRVLKGDIKNLRKFTAMTRLYVSNAGLSGDIAELPGTALLHLFTPDNTELGGKISSLRKFADLNDIHISGTNITGSLESLVFAYRADGKTESIGNGLMVRPTFAGGQSFTKVTFKGELLTNSANAYLTWTSNPNTITFNGITIEA